eukprot:TRINITY_DN23980_c0_g1_i1.p1 TRINITY_DN23980_c0_g1~~TRINITY_DN23980_c0_g1_i1.p1  ORF type:complete len:138 (-),score=12.35 TRINITY_DN23980_c0_g1_i1:293-706(-)
MALDSSCRKFFVSFLNYEKLKRQDSNWYFGEMKFQRVWIQGTITAVNPKWFLLDDGTGSIIVDTANMKDTLKINVTLGMYALVVGRLTASSDGTRISVHAHKVSDLSDEPNSESLWALEVPAIHHEVYSRPDTMALT